MRKGQGAMEYLMTYGWAILIVIIVGIVLFRSGLFGVTGTGVSGFTKMVPHDWKITNGSNQSQIIFTNDAGQGLSSITVAMDTSSPTDCDTINTGTTALGAGRALTAYLNCSDRCGTGTLQVGAGVKINVLTTFKGEGGLTKTETGTIFAKCE